jgi:zinc transporter
MKAHKAVPASEAAEGYGADRNGMVWAYAFEPGLSSRPVPPEALRDSLAATVRDGEFLWLHFVTSASSERWMRANLDLPEGFYEGLHGETASTRLEQQDLSLVSVLHDVLFGFAFDPSDISTVILCITPHLVVSARLKPLRSVDRLRAAVRAGHPFGSSAGLLSHLLRDQAGVLADIVRRSTARVDGIEDQLLGDRITASRREMGALRRMLVRFQRLLAPEPAAMFRLLNQPPGWIREEDIRDLRNSAEEFSAAVSDSMSLAERVKLLQEEVAARINEDTGRTLFFLTMVTVAALPINLAAALFGMNVGGIPLSSHPSGFWMIVTGLLAFTAALAWIFTRRFRPSRGA